MEGDCQKVINILNNKQLQFDSYNWVREIRWWIQIFEDFQLTWIGRKGNSVTDKLAKQQMLNQDTLCIHNYVPTCINLKPSLMEVAVKIKNTSKCNT